MGAGKTSVGRRLAELLGVPFRDSDDAIAEAAGRSIPEIFAAYGEEEFRRGETAVLSRLMESEPSVLSTGGGAFISDENRAVIGAKGVSVWLNVELDVLWSRVKDKSGRPLLEAADPYAVLAELHRERTPIYGLADVTVASSNAQNQEDVAKMVVRALGEFHKAHPERQVFEKGGEDG